MKTRIKAISEIKSRAEFDQLLENIVTLQLVREKLIIRREYKLLAVRGEFDPDIKDLAENMEASVLRAEKYAAAHREELFTMGAFRKKSAETSFAFFGFRTGNPTLVLLNRKWTWGMVLEALKKLYQRDYVIIKESVDKDAVKRDMAGDALAEVGLRVAQSEVFFIDPKRDPADPQRLVSVAKEAAPARRAA